jgi:hypothetical protein
MNYWAATDALLLHGWAACMIHTSAVCTVTYTTDDTTGGGCVGRLCSGRGCLPPKRRPRCCCCCCCWVCNHPAKKRLANLFEQRGSTCHKRQLPIARGGACCICYPATGQHQPGQCGACWYPAVQLHARTRDHRLHGQSQAVWHHLQASKQFLWTHQAVQLQGVFELRSSRTTSACHMRYRRCYIMRCPVTQGW